MLGKILLACVTAADVAVETAESIESVSLARHEGLRVVEFVHYARHGPYMEVARNDLVRTFNHDVHKDCDKLLIVDSDIEFRPEHVVMLDALDLDCVSGVYHSQFGMDFLPIVHEWEITDEETGRRNLVGIQKWDDGWPNFPDMTMPHGIPSCIEVGGFGAGFMMVKRHVLDAMEARYGDPCPWFAEPIIEGIVWGEDLEFCRRVQECGFATHVERACQVAHWKRVRVGYPI